MSLAKCRLLFRIVARAWHICRSFLLGSPKFCPFSFADSNLLDRHFGDGLIALILAWSRIAIHLSLLLLSHMSTFDRMTKLFGLISVVSGTWKLTLSLFNPVVLPLSLANSHRTSHVRPDLGSVGIVLTRARIRIILLFNPSTHGRGIMSLSKCRFLFRIVTRAWHICSYPLLNRPQF